MGGSPATAYNQSMAAQGLSILLRLQEQLEALGQGVEMAKVPGKLRAVFDGTGLMPHLKAVLPKS